MLGRTADEMYEIKQAVSAASAASAARVLSLVIRGPVLDHVVAHSGFMCARRAIRPSSTACSRRPTSRATSSASASRWRTCRSAPSRVLLPAPLLARACGGSLLTVVARFSYSMSQDEQKVRCSIMPEVRTINFKTESAHLLQEIAKFD
jgi:hypothetical protein